jgi:uncharacterized membrane protein
VIYSLKNNFLFIPLGDYNVKSQTVIHSALVGVVALGVMAASGNALAAKEGAEKCYGVVKAGMNDCGAADKSHSCAGQATEDGSANEWVYVPSGTCDKLVGGTLEPDAG